MDALEPAARNSGGRLLAPLRRQFAWIVWGIGAGVYVLAVFHRTSLGVAGPMAENRFSVGAAQLGAFILLQLAVYAMMQIPTGILVDRFGPRKMLLAATSVMGSAQLMFALVETYPLALLARALLGCGDAMTYISVLRLVAAWFPARRYAVLTSVTGLLGSLGNVIATLPLTALLTHAGWGITFGVAGALSLGYGLLLLRPATRAPLRHAGAAAAAGPVAGHRVWAEVRAAWRMPAGRLGFWVHLTAMTGPSTFGVLWGYPYLVDGLGYSDSRASLLLLLLVVVGSMSNLAIGVAVTRRPAARTPLAVVVVLACLIGWVVLIAWPGGRPPIGVLIAVIGVLATGGPASAVAFFLARDYNPRHRISTATGLVNVGGWVGTMTAVYLVGQIVDLVDAGRPSHSLAAFRWAFAAIAVITAFGLSRMLTWWLRTRAEVLMAAARGEDVPVTIRVHRWELVDAALLAREAARAHGHPVLGPPPQQSDGVTEPDKTTEPGAAEPDRPTEQDGASDPAEHT